MNQRPHRAVESAVQQTDRRLVGRRPLGAGHRSEESSATAHGPLHCAEVRCSTISPIASGVPSVASVNSSVTVGSTTPSRSWATSNGDNPVTASVGIDPMGSEAPSRAAARTRALSWSSRRRANEMTPREVASAQCKSSMITRRGTFSANEDNSATTAAPSPVASAVQLSRPRIPKRVRRCSGRSLWISASPGPTRSRSADNG